MAKSSKPNWEGLTPPASIGRIAAFLDSVSHEPPTTIRAQSEIGAVGSASQNLASRIKRRVTTGHVSDPGEEGLHDRYAIQSGEVREFTRWLFRVKEKAPEEPTVHYVLQETPPVVIVQERRVPELNRAEMDRLISEAVEQRLKEISAEQRKPKRRPKDEEEEQEKPKRGEREDSGLSLLTKGMLAGTNRFLWSSALGLGSASLGMAFGRHEAEMLGASQFAAPVGGGAVPLIPPNIAWRTGGLLPGRMPGAALGFGGGGPTGLAMPLAEVVAATSPAMMSGAPGYSPGYGLPVNVLPAQLAVARYVMAGTQGAPEMASDAGIGPQHGQITLFAPPVTVASDRLSDAGSGVALQWSALSAGTAPLDAAGLQQIQMLLPDGVQAIYPALPPGALGTDGVNLPLAPSLARQLIGMGYGIDDPGAAMTASSMALAQRGGSPVAQTLLGSWVPVARPMQQPASLLDPDSAEAGLDFPLGGAARHDGPLDFLGLPVRLAPTLQSDTRLRDLQDAKASGSSHPGPYVVRPEDFWPLASGAFDSFQSLEAQPDVPAWQRAAPEFGLPDATPSALLSPGYSGPDSHFASAALDGSGVNMSFRHQPVPSLGASSFGPPIEPGSTESTPGWPMVPPAMPTPSATSIPPAAAGFSGGTGFGGSLGAPGAPKPGFGATSSPPARASAGPRPSVRERYTLASFVAPMLLRSAPTMFGLGGGSFAGGGQSGTPAAFSTVFGAQSRTAPALASAMMPGSFTGRPATPEVESARETAGSAKPSALQFGYQGEQGVQPSANPADSPTVGLSPDMGFAPGGKASQAQRQQVPIMLLPVGQPQPAEVPPGIPAPWMRPSPSPDMLYRPNRPVQGPMAIQAAHDAETSPARASEKSPHRESARSNELGNATQEINVLANEVWTILKRRIVVDAERSGIR